MQKITIVLMALVASGAAQAQDAASALASAPAAAESNCELHIWPTENYIGINTGLLSGMGLLGVVADGAVHKDRVATVKDMMRDYLGPDVQIEELRKAKVAEALGLPGYQIIVEEATPAPADLKKDPALKAKYKALSAKLKSGARLSGSTAPCYAELIGHNIFYHKAMMYGSNLFAAWSFRDFGNNGTAKPRRFDGAVKNPLEDFPAKTVEKTEAAKIEIRDAYSKDFLEYVQKKVHGAAAATAAK